MPILKTVAEEISNNDLVAGIIEEIIAEESLYWLLPFVRTDGKAYVYNRETVIADSDFLAPNSEVKESDSQFKSITTHLRILIGDVDVDKFIDATMSDTNDQKAIQLAMKAKGMGRRFKDALVNGKIVGRTNPNTGKPIDNVDEEFEGIRQIWKSGITSSVSGDDAGPGLWKGWKEFWVDQIIAMDESNNPDDTDDKIVVQALSLEKLDELLDAIPGGADFLMMRKDTYRAYKAMLRLSGGITPEQIMIKDFGKVPAHDGTPIIINDYLPTLSGTNSDGYTEIYALRCNEVDGLHGLYGGSNAGIVVEDIGTVQNKDATRTRLKWYAGLALKSTKSMAVLRGVKASARNYVKPPITQP